jgi:hypothetical protein
VAGHSEQLQKIRRKELTDQQPAFLTLVYRARFSRTSGSAVFDLKE